MTASNIFSPEVRAVPPRLQETEIQRRVPFVLDMKEGWALKRLLAGVVAAACFLAAAGLWVLPSSLMDPAAALIKSGLTAALLAGGISILRSLQAMTRPEACFDPVRRELRIWLKAGAGRPHTVLRRSYDSIGCVRLGLRSAAVYEPDGRLLLLRLPLSDARAHKLLRAHLLGAVPVEA